MRGRTSAHPLRCIVRKIKALRCQTMYASVNVGAWYYQAFHPGSIRCRIGFRPRLQCTASAIRKHVAGREQNGYSAVPAGEHGDDKTVTRRSQKGYMGGAAGVRPCCIRCVSKSLRNRCAVLSRCGVSVSFLLYPPPAATPTPPEPASSGFLVEHKATHTRVCRIGRQPAWLLGLSCKTKVVIRSDLYAPAHTRIWPARPTWRQRCDARKQAMRTAGADVANIPAAAWRGAWPYLF